MKIERAIRELQNSINVGLCPDVESRKLAIRSLEAWEKVKCDIHAGGIMGEPWVMNVIDKHLSEVEGGK